MANVTISPNMNLPIPTVSQDPGPDWANNIVACLSIIDMHTHVPFTSGVQVNPTGININSDLPFNGNNAVSLRTARFTPQAATLQPPGTDLDCLYVVGVDLYYNDGNGNSVRITQAGSVPGAAGTITGLPSGTASASYGAGAFTFQSATNTPAAINGGALTIANASNFGVTLNPNVAQSSNYSLGLPVAAPAVGQILRSDGSGNLTWVGFNNAAGQWVLPLGSPGTPSLVFTGDASTGIRGDGIGDVFVTCQGNDVAEFNVPEGIQIFGVGTNANANLSLLPTGSGICAIRSGTAGASMSFFTNVSAATIAANSQWTLGNPAVSGLFHQFYGSVLQITAVGTNQDATLQLAPTGSGYCLIRSGRVNAPIQFFTNIFAGSIDGPTGAWVIGNTAAIGGSGYGGASIVGSTAGSTMGTGYVGEVLTQTFINVNAGTSSSPTEIASIVLTSGVWLISVGSTITVESGDSMGPVVGNLSTAPNSGTPIVTPGYGSSAANLYNIGVAGVGAAINISPCLVTPTSSTTYYFNTTTTWTGGSFPLWNGAIQAVRIV